ncbi:hypothetical protein PPL_07665 [Heterostelium album PN500]|uniref:Ribosome recycling factor domain-containing protein n=1 Tax=Heterostelium pallidum (strain ATCC 26659 / Pp 5 / PN500) TaxID=670386 RepID=D3BGL3_HETP5|nr:hypothetical protein PPL_07665 [Heterostelium album PN500]EFA79247.1 hypothetical protein PPL_07665 [Heterostelium album PN500]|eukprot:XP_020431368.1 hypothetical protein PPL_07665 [Heterostelium album PN500]
MTSKIVLLFLFFTIVIFVNSQECDPRCDCDKVSKVCPDPRNCKKPNPDGCDSYIECDDGLYYEVYCQEGLYWNNNGQILHVRWIESEYWSNHLIPNRETILRFNNINNINIIGTCITNQSKKLCSNSLRLTTTTSSSSSVRTYYTRVSAINQYNGNVVCIDSRAKKGGGGGGGKNDKKEKEVAYDSVKDVDLNTMKSSCDATVDFLRRGFGNIRCGRTGPELLDLITVETPNGPMSMNQIAMVTIKDPLTLHLTLFDPSLLKHVEKALRSRSDLGMSPQIQDQFIKLTLPKPTQELRQNLIKSVNNLSEQAKVSIRRHRKEGMDLIKKKYKLIKDDEQKIDKNVQKITDDYIATLTKLTDAKIKEINTN